MCSSLKVGQWIEQSSSTFLQQGVFVTFTNPFCTTSGSVSRNICDNSSFTKLGGRLPSREVVDRFVLIHKVDKHRLDPPALGLISD